MSVLTRIFKLGGLAVATAVPALAATGERELASNYAVWMFLGFCALIIVAQIFPLVWQLFHKRSKHAAGQEQAMDKVPEA